MDRLLINGVIKRNSYESMQIANRGTKNNNMDDEDFGKWKLHQMTHRLNKGQSVRDGNSNSREKIGCSNIYSTREMDQSVQKRMQMQAPHPINS